MKKLLVIDSNGFLVNTVRSRLAQTYNIVSANSVKQGLDMLRSQPVSAVLLDQALTQYGGDGVIRKIGLETDTYLPIIVVSDNENNENAAEAVREGACDFIPRNSSADIFSDRIHRALGRRSVNVPVPAVSSESADRQGGFVYRSEKMKRLDNEITKLANLDFDLLLIGETGAGKDLIASLAHCRSGRADKPFIPIAISSLSESLIESELFGHEKGAFSNADKAKMGKFEAANGGTVYLPEISSLNENVQLKLLYFMQYKTILRVGQDPRKPETQLDVRLIMATNQDPVALVSSGRLRKDFYHRICGVHLQIPPLRDHIEDVEALADYFLKKFSGCPVGTKYEIAPEAMEALKAHGWPGNIRELENSIKHALAFANSPVLQLENFPCMDSSPSCYELSREDLGIRTSLPPYRESLLNFKKSYFRNLWQLSGMNVSKAARLSSLTPRGIRKILDELGVD